MLQGQRAYILRKLYPNEGKLASSLYDGPARQLITSRRKDALIKETVGQGRFFVLEEETGTVAAGAAIYNLSARIKYGIADTTGKSLVAIRNLGEVEFLQPLGKDTHVVAADSLFAVCCLQTLLHAKEWGISALTTRFAAETQSSTQRLQRLAVPWEEFAPEVIYKAAVRRTLAGRIGRSVPLRAFVTAVGAAVFGAASYLAGREVQTQDGPVSSPFWHEESVPNVIFTRGHCSPSDHTQQNGQSSIKIELAYMPELIPFARTMVSDGGKRLLAIPDTETWDDAHDHIINFRPLRAVAIEPLRIDKHSTTVRLQSAPA